MLNVRARRLRHRVSFVFYGQHVRGHRSRVIHRTQATEGRRNPLDERARFDAHNWQATSLGFYNG